MIGRLSWCDTFDWTKQAVLQAIHLAGVIHLAPHGDAER